MEVDGKIRDELKQCELYYDKTAFFGKITAGVSHEINNVMTVINEYSGLISDLVVMSENGQQEPDIERFGKLASSVTEQIVRGKEIVQRLNRFSHSSDEPVSTFDVGEVIADIVELTRHYAKAMNFVVSVEKTDVKAVIVSDPFRFQQAVFICTQIFQENHADLQSCKISWKVVAESVELTIEGGKITESEDLKMQKSFLSKLVEKLGGVVKININQKENSFCVLTIPFKTKEQRQEFS